MIFIKRSMPIFLVFIFVCGLSFYAWAEDGEDTVYDLKLGIDYHYDNHDDYPGKIGEYIPLDHDSSGPGMNISGKAMKKGLYLDFSGRYFNEDDYKGKVSGDYKRIILEDFTYDSFEHWLDHDDMDNLCGKTGAVVVSHEDFNAGEDYIIQRSEQKSDTTLNLPFSPGTSVHFNYRRQKKEGQRQAMTLSHCGTCHVTSHSREINEETEDYKAGFSKKFSNLTMEYDYFHREFNERGASPLNYYDDPTHPGGKGDIFDDRIQYGDEALYYDQVPSMEKDMHTVRFSALLPAESAFFASYVFSNTENNDYDLETDSNTVDVKLTNNYFPGLQLSAKFRYMDIDNDDIYVDINEPLSVAGLNAGYTWYDHNPALGYTSFDPDYIRESALSRDIMTMGFDARYQLFRKTSVNLGYEWEEVDRDDFAVDDSGDTETTTNTFKVGMSTRPFQRVKMRLNYKLEDTDDPFNFVNGACEQPFTTDPGGPFNGTQYWERHLHRIADLSNQPTLAHEVFADINWSVLSNFFINLSYRYIDEENDETDVLDWEKESHVPAVSFSFIPTQQLSFNFSYMYDWTETETLANIPVFDG